jgi:hypothetical protein
MCRSADNFFQLLLLALREGSGSPECPGKVTFFPMAADFGGSTSSTRISNVLYTNRSDCSYKNLKSTGQERRHHGSIQKYHLISFILD